MVKTTFQKLDAVLIPSSVSHNYEKEWELNLWQSLTLGYGLFALTIVVH